MLPLPGTAENVTLQDSTTPMASAADRRRGNGARTGARDSPSGATVSRETVFRGPRRLDHYGPMSESVGTTNRGPFDWAERAANTRVVSGPRRCAESNGDRAARSVGQATTTASTETTVCEAETETV